MNESLVSVALPLPFQAPFSYRLPRGAARPERGVRVLVPFGSRRVIGVVCGDAPETKPLDLKEVLQVLDETPLVPPPLLDLASFVADHYLAPPGECYRLVLPPAGVRASRAVVRLVQPGGADDPLLRHLQDGPLRLSALEKRLGSDPQARVARLRRDGVVAVEQAIDAPGFRELQVATLVEEDAATRGTAQSEVVARLRAAGGRLRVSDLVRDRPSLRSAVDRLAQKGTLRLDSERELRAPAELPPREALAVVPTEDQERALADLLAAVSDARFSPFLLHGVTGSGKTEVYFRAAEAALGRGRGAILLVPEIGLTPMLVRAARARFGATVSVLHSELAAGERHDEWWRIREGEARVVVGARSAVFAPVAELGLMVVDEEHDGAYKQDESPRYHGRDVAVMRAKLEGAVVVLGSATPSLETFTNAGAGKYERLTLPKRISSQGLPTVEIVDRRQVMKAGGDAILTPPLRDALETRLRRKEQALLLLNRRGYAISLLCRECGQEADCPNCSVSLALHEGGRRAVCHYCAFQTAPPSACPACKGAYLKQRGYGTEKVVESVCAAFPEARVDRLDRDRAARRGEL
ncbi:MAG TPA: primosomal protein N', partial [Vicinamibacteria bacterium]